MPHGFGARLSQLSGPVKIDREVYGFSLTEGLQLIGVRKLQAHETLWFSVP